MDAITNTKAQQAIKYCENQHAPVSIEITNICSARCSFCWYGKGGDWRKPGYIPDDVLDRFITLLREHADNNEVVNLSTAHGDVLTNKNLPDIIRKITAISGVTGVPFFTNGILLHRFDIDELLNLKIHHANFSTALGSEEQYQRLYGKDSYKRTFNNIVNFLKKNNKKGNKKIPARVLLRVDKPFSKIIESDDYKIIEDLIGRHRISFLEEWDDYNGLIRDEDLPRGHFFKKVKPISSIPCYALYRKLEVLKDGDVSCCICRLSKELIVGNIFEADSMIDIWNGVPLKQLRSNWLSGEFPKICSTCTHYQPVTGLYRSLKRNKNIFFKNIDLLRYRIGV